MKIETTATSSPCAIPSLIVPPGSTPMTIADAVIREVHDKDLIEDVIYYLECYMNRAYPEDKVSFDGCKVSPHSDIEIDSDDPTIEKY